MAQFHYQHRFLTMNKMAAILVLTVIAGACTRTKDSSPAFTEQWRRETEAARAEQRTRERARGTIIGDEDDAVRVGTDERGRPRVEVGGERVRADVDVRGGEPRVQLRYEMKWGGARRDMPSQIPRPGTEEEPESEGEDEDTETEN